jgi:hypothetical protein
MNVYKTTPRNYCKIRQGDPDWHFKADEFTLVSRTELEISELCPHSVKQALWRAIGDGHIKLVANIPEREYMWEKLQS